MKPLLLSALVTAFLCFPTWADTFPTPAWGILPRLEYSRDPRRAQARQKLAEARMKQVEVAVKQATARAKQAPAKARNVQRARNQAELFRLQAQARALNQRTPPLDPHRGN